MDHLEQQAPEVRFRRGSADDNRAAHAVLVDAFAELRASTQPVRPDNPEEATPEAREAAWQKLRPLYEHLARTSEQFWIAERDDTVVGYARTTLRDGVRELTELFVAPGLQAGGVGKQLLGRAFPAGGARLRAVIAAPNPVAQVLYMRAGVYPRFPIAGFSRAAEAVEVPPGLEFRPLTGDAATLDMLAAIDAEVVGFRRDLEHRWLVGERQGFAVLRDGRPLGYGYLGAPGGPWALLDPAAFPVVLAFAEHHAAQNGQELSLQVPTINQHAVAYLLERGCRMNPSYAIFMTDRPLGSFERYVLMSPMFFV